MKFNKSYLIAAGLFSLIAVWFLINSGKTHEPAETTPIADAQQEQTLPVVVVRQFTATEHPQTFNLFGRTEPRREVAVKAETPGLVVSTPIAEGRRIGKGTVICRQDVDARQANVDQARANLKARESDYSSTSILVEKGYRSAIQLDSLKAAVDGAKAAVKQAEIELDNVNMRAPFSGIFDQQMAEVGDYLAPGQPCGKLVELNPIVVAVELTETQVGQVTVGQKVEVDLVTGQTVTGKLTFIQASAKAATRTFGAEIHVPNADYKIKAGVTANAAVIAGMTKAQQIPGKVLTLDAEGTVGVRYLDASDYVRFAKISVIDEGVDGVWVTGLPDSTRVIIEGQNFVTEGIQVKPTYNALSTAAQ